MTKIKATAIHLAGSILALLAFVSLLLFVWYPQPFFTLDASWSVIQIVAGVDVVVGPLLTFIIFKHGKPGLRFDLTVIVMMQLSFLSYGVYVAYHERPLYAVFSVDRFTLVSSRHVDEDLAVPALTNSAWAGPTIVYTLPPVDADERSDMLGDMVKGERNDPALMPERYRLLQPHLPEVLARGIDVGAKAAGDPEKERRIEGFLRAHGGTVEDYAFLPVEGRKSDALLAFARADRELVGLLNMDPW